MEPAAGGPAASGPAASGPAATGPAGDPGRAIPDWVQALLDRLRAEGAAAYVVGGSLRDILLDRLPLDWDLTTSARPEAIQALFRESTYENAFGTVAVRVPNGEVVQITTFRSDHDYADFRRPHRVEFGDTVEDDLARRDFTMNAIAWGSKPGEAAGLVDPFGGQADIGDRLLRAVGDPATRFGEDALRMLRAVRLAAVLGFRIDQRTLDAIGPSAGLAAHLSGERVSAEFLKLLDAPRPSVGLRLAEETGLLDVLAPVLAEQRGVAQNKLPGEDLWDHTVRSVDAAASAGRSTRVRLATLLHDIGKPATAADGHFYRHETVGAGLAADLLRRWHAPRVLTDEVTHLVAQHMFNYDDAWSDGAVRRFIVKIGRDALDDLFALREADNIGSGQPGDAGGLTELRSRVAAQLAANVALDRSGLAIDGDVLIAKLELTPGPLVGRLLERLVERVVMDPGLNDPESLLELAREMQRSMPARTEDG
ncbi:MAG TPA: HD domain-containing protein [Candidatus Acidoferrum sp.]|nr:HD domain-containing protein [Candidatus Acidoferrum sp.]